MKGQKMATTQCRLSRSSIETSFGRQPTTSTVLSLLSLLQCLTAEAWVATPSNLCQRSIRYIDSSIATRRHAKPPIDLPWGDDNSNGNNNSGQWLGSDEETIEQQSTDWMDVMESKQDGSFWTSFESAEDDAGDGDNNAQASSINSSVQDEEDESDAWLDTLASLSAEEVEFNQMEAERADMARKMEEYQFPAEVIASTLGIATDASLEDKDEVDGMADYRKKAYESWDDVDLETVESHTMVAKDKETGDPIRSQMVYVDEHTCIGCTNCATIAQSTFFMHSEHGRARVFSQWGDDDETIQVAIETCPVDCIHYVPYDELVELEVERRDQNINFKARLVSQAEYASSVGGGVNGFTAPQEISGNMGTRCSNCPSRGCRNCPMYGVGKNPEFERKEKLRKEKMERNRLKRERKEQQKSADL